jgi:type I restriction enzyme, R subunit
MDARAACRPPTTEAGPLNTTDTTEHGLESLIVRRLLSTLGYVEGSNAGYDRNHVVDTAQLATFLVATQPEVADALRLEEEGPSRTQFLHRLQSEVTKRGVIDVLRKGVKHGAASVELFYGTPTSGNALAESRFAANVFSVTRQLRYSRDEAQLALDLAIFINGLPVATFELKNSLTKQTVEDAVQQYKRDRDPREPLFVFGRCAVHFAVDDHEVRMCTHLRGKNSWFLPFNRGVNDGAGNPPNPHGIKTDYLWKDLLAKRNLTDILENYAQIVEEKDDKGRRTRSQIFPRYHQLGVVRSLLGDMAQHGVGKRYLIEHSAGSGKSHSIAWLAHQLVGLQRDGEAAVDSVIVVTDRIILDRQIRDTIRQFSQVSSTVGHAENSGDLRRFLASGKKLVISTVFKFPAILDEIGNEHRDSKFAIIIDEAHSSQGGRTAAAVNIALSAQAEADDSETTEDMINRIMESRKMLPNASYFAFTATPKNRTLEVFGDRYAEAGEVKRRPFHVYTMKQAIDEGFILDVVKHYTPVNSYYHIARTVEDDPEFDVRRAHRKLRRYVESHDHAIQNKADVMISHFSEQVLARRKIGGQARAMVVANSVDRAIQYFHAFREHLRNMNSPHAAIVAFSGERDHRGQDVTEASLNGFPGNSIPEKFKADPYRFLIVAEKFQTGYDEPLLHTMYVDKPLAGIRAVQTLSRLNRAHPIKHDTFVLDFVNDADTIRDAFDPYYRATLLSSETDPNRLHDLKGDLDGYRVYRWDQVERLTDLYLTGEDRDRLDPILDACVAEYTGALDEQAQIEFKGKSKAFARAYNFLASVLPYGNAEWERLAMFLNFLIPKLPAPQEEDLAQGILQAIDMDSYRIEARQAMSIALSDEDAEIDPVPPAGTGHPPEPDLDRLSNIIRSFNDLFGNIDWLDEDKIRQLITEEIPEKVAADARYQNAKKQADANNARVEHDRALHDVILAMLSDHTELYKQFMDNADFKRWLGDRVFNLTYGPAAD